MDYEKIVSDYLDEHYAVAPYGNTAAAFIAEYTDDNISKF